MNATADGTLLDITPLEIWRGKSSSTASEHCSNWTNGTNGSQGVFTYAYYAYLNNYIVGGVTTDLCNTQRRLLCFQDGDGIVTPSKEPSAIKTKKMFVTSQTGNGQLTTWPLTIAPGTAIPGGVKRGDAICNQLAQNAGVEGTFKVFLSATTTTDPVDRFVNGTEGPYVTVTGYKLVDDLSMWSLPESMVEFDKNIFKLGIEDETGELELVDNPFFLGINAYGAISNCSNWSSQSGNANATGGIGFGFSYFFDSYACSASHRLLCVEE
ncbi:MAG: hypothetical protein R3A11_02020 [Bdellovibrionota bacterium]